MSKRTRKRKDIFDPYHDNALANYWFGHNETNIDSDDMNEEEVYEMLQNLQLGGVNPEEDILLAASVNDDENLLEGAQWIKCNTQNSNIEGPILF